MSNHEPPASSSKSTPNPACSHASVALCALALLSSSGFLGCASKPVYFDSYGATFTFFQAGDEVPEWVQPPAGDSIARTLYRFDHLDVWAADETLADSLSQQIEEAHAVAEKLFHWEPLHLTLVVVDERHLPEATELGSWGRTPNGFIMAWPTIGFLNSAFIERGTQLARQAYAGTWFASWLSIEGDFTPASSYLLSFLLTHEYGHLVVIDLTGETDSSHTRQYGSRLPDWMDEAVAVMFEPDEVKKSRRAARGLVFRQGIPLQRFLSMEHPDALDDPLGKDWVRVKLELRVDEPPDVHAFAGAPESDGLFYQQCLLFSDFLIETWGMEGFLTVLSEAARRPSPVNSLELVTDLSGGKVGPAELESMWNAWLENG